MRRPLGPVQTGRRVEDAGILLDDLIDLIGEEVEDEDDIFEGLVNNFTTVQLEQIATEVQSPPLPSSSSSVPKRKKKKSASRVSIAKKHSNAYEKVRQMR